ncbi:non-ribosomal peptide synthetase module [Paenibacillus flagellatus]|uniref:Non-ribosomal peptide synthetase module n=1 Tax=Paenibacillus flagellatus TaxID=2211139 RepID=A0A2V5K0U0_9BACL|nr:non-ribosomal peptide synthetase module [Paenibacillus flagellatus]PYI52202.1 non-ribosomal peptide synthetase module [Paenibacillus flagellatus]
MAQRLATEYVKTCLTLTEAEMIQFMKLFEEQGVHTEGKATGDGSREIVLRDDSGEEVVLTFLKQGDRYACEGSCRVSDPKLANLIRKAVSQFKGDAIVNRIYPAFTMKYVYKRGSVVQISEIVSGKHKLVYEYKDTVGQLERLYRQQHVEQQISQVYVRIDELLDERNRSESAAGQRTVDEQLARLAHKLFELEA